MRRKVPLNQRVSESDLLIAGVLTYMSIDEMILALHGNRKLYEVRSPWLDDGDESPRKLYVSADIDAVITPPFPDTKHGERLGEFRAWLENFVEYGEITVCDRPCDKPPETMLARTSPVEAGFWSIRVTLPEDSPGIRSLGAFAATNEFIALTWDYREVIADDFDGEVQAVQDSWRDHFGSMPPFEGEYPSEYLANCRPL